MTTATQPYPSTRQQSAVEIREELVRALRVLPVVAGAECARGPGRPRVPRRGDVGRLSPRGRGAGGRGAYDRAPGRWRAARARRARVGADAPVRARRGT